MTISWQDHHDLEVREKYPDAIDALEERLRESPGDTEAVVRLGVNLWNMAVEGCRVGLAPSLEERYRARFAELFLQYKDELLENAEFCYWYGLGIQLFWMYFPDMTEDMGNELMRHAGQLDGFWARMQDMPNLPSQEELKNRLSGRGILASYYNVA